MLLVGIFNAVMLCLIILHLLQRSKWQSYSRLYIRFNILRWLYQALMMHKISLMRLMHHPCRIFTEPHISMTAWFISNMTRHNYIRFSVEWWACSPSTPRWRRIILFIISWWSLTYRCSSPRLYLLLNLLCHIMLMIIACLWRLLMLLPPSDPSIIWVVVLYL